MKGRTNVSDQDDQTTEGTDEIERPAIRERMAKLEREAADAAAIRRENAMLKAGINPDDPKQRYFAKAYDGDLTPEAIKAEATAAGILGATPPPAAQQVSADERAALGRVGATTAGADTGSPDYLTLIRESKDADEVRANWARAREHGL